MKIEEWEYWQEKFKGKSEEEIDAYWKEEMRSASDESEGLIMDAVDGLPLGSRVEMVKEAHEIYERLKQENSGKNMEYEDDER